MLSGLAMVGVIIQLFDQQFQVVVFMTVKTWCYK